MAPTIEHHGGHSRTPVNLKYCIFAHSSQISKISVQSFVCRLLSFHSLDIISKYFVNALDIMIRNNIHIVDRRFELIESPLWLRLVFRHFWGINFQPFVNYFVWLRITEEGSVPEMRIWSILLIKSDLKWCIHLSKSLFLNWRIRDAPTFRKHNGRILHIAANTSHGKAINRSLSNEHLKSYGKATVG